MGTVEEIIMLSGRNIYIKEERWTLNCLAIPIESFSYNMQHQRVRIIDSLIT